MDPETRPFRIALVGAGHVSSAHLAAYAELGNLVRLAAICDVNLALARSRAAEYGVTAAFGRVDALLQEVDCDAVDVCTVHDQHYPIALAAIHAGKHVLLEKPFACTVEQCTDLINAADRAGVQLMVAHQQRFDPSYLGVAKLINDGTLGKIHAARIDAMQDMRQYAAPGHWLYDSQRAGGGILISVLIHKVDLLRFFIGEVKRVSAKCLTTNANFVNGAEDYIFGLLEFESGAVAEIFGAYSPVRMPYGEGLMLFGEAGTVHCIEFGKYVGPAVYATDSVPPAGLGWEERQYTGFVGVPPAREGLFSDRPVTNALHHFIACCEAASEPESSGRRNLGTMQTVCGIYESCRTGGPVDLR